MTPDSVFPYYKQSPQWGNYLEDFHWKSFLLSNDVRVFILPSVLGGLCKVQRPRFIDEKTLIELDELGKEHHLLFAKIEPGNPIDPDLLNSYGYDPSSSPLLPPSSLYINLGVSEEILWGNLSRSGKYGVNRANREGCEVIISNNPSDSELKEYRRLLGATERRRGFLSLSYKELTSVRNNFSDESYLVTSRNKDNALTGGKFFVGYGGVISYITGGATKEGTLDRSGYKLFWESIKYFNSMSYRILDLEGCYDPRYKETTKNWKGFTEFKMKFGPYEVNYPGVYVKMFPKLLRPLAKYF